MLHASHFTDADGHPAGGTSYGIGFAIGWQNGPLRAANGKSLPRNGAFVEDVIVAARDRLQHYQTTQFRSEWNTRAIILLENALNELRSRTEARRAAGVEGTHEIGPTDEQPQSSG